MISIDVATTELWIKIMGGAIAAAAAIFATFKALAEWRRSTQQRAEELDLRQREFRHKQAIFARELILEVFADPKARAALTMLDWTEFDYEEKPGVSHTISQWEIKKAMTSSEDADDKEVFIRTRFEALYDYVEQIEHLISLDIVNFADVDIPFRYYMENLLRPDIEHVKFLDDFGYPGAKAFAFRFQMKATQAGLDSTAAVSPSDRRSQS